MEYLWRVGELEICHREGFTKFYDLTHRIIPKVIAEEHHSEAQNVDWFCHGALERLGFATTGEIADFWWVVRKDEAKSWASKEDLVEVDVQAHNGRLRRHLMLPETLAGVADLPDPPRRVRVLSPFDPMLRDRNRAARLFGFQYRIEIFVPEARRVYGYCVFPLLEGEQIVGRVDMKADRKSGVLRVKALWPECGIKWGACRHARFEAELVRICRLAGVDEVVWSDGWLRETKL